MASIQTHSICSKWLVEIDNHNLLFEKEFGRLDPAQLNAKPAPESWSIAQNIEHLIVINESYYPVVQHVINHQYKPPFLGRFDFMVNWMGKMILDSVSPSGRRKMKTFPIWQPSSSAINGDIVARFQKHHHGLKEMIMKCEPLLGKRTVISSPANRNIVYTLDKALDIIVAHEKRHFEQARVVKSTLGLD